MPAGLGSDCWWARSRWAPGRWRINALSAAIPSLVFGAPLMPDRVAPTGGKLGWVHLADDRPGVRDIERLPLRLRL